METTTLLLRLMGCLPNRRETMSPMEEVSSMEPQEEEAAAFMVLRADISNPLITGE